MKNIAFIDDDLRNISQFAMRFLGDNDFNTDIFSRSADFRKHLSLNRCDIAIIDLMMDPTDDDVPKGMSDDHYGVYIASEAKRINPNCITYLITGSYTVSLDYLNQFSFVDQAIHKSKLTPAYLERLVRKSLGLTKSNIRSFIVHGHDELRQRELKDFLQNTLGFAEPTVLMEKPSLGMTIIEKFDEYGSDVDAVFVLATPDDIVDQNQGIKRARQNVILELGYFMGKLGRMAPIIILTTSEVEIPSGLSGVIWIDVSSGISASSEDIRRELKAHGLLA